MEAEDGYCNTRLGLGLGYGDYVPRPKIQKNKAMVCLDLSFTLCPKEEAMNSSIQHVDDNKEERSCFKSSSVIEDGEEYSNKRGRHAIDTNKDGTGTGKKKLRLTKEQSALLEESFKLHTTLNPAQKQALAEQLNLKQRQVEVWFQNRRARTKLKQTEVDCEFLRKCCENLSDENRRLKKELQELRSGRIGRSSPFHFSKDATITMCPSCEKRTTAGQKNAASFDVVQAS